MKLDDLPEWERLLAAERHLQLLVPGRVLVGGTAAALQQLSGVSPLAEVVERLAEAAPSDHASVDFSTYRGLIPPWNDWAYVTERGRAWAPVIARIVCEAGT